MIFIKKLQSKLKSRSFAIFWFYFNFSIKLFNNLFRKIKSKTNPMNIHLVWVLNVSKHLKQFRFIFWFDSNSSVYNRNLDVVLIVFLYNICFNSYSPFVCKLKSIWLEVQHHLLYPLFVMIDHRIVQITQITFQLNIFSFGFDLLNKHNFIYVLI